MGQSCFRRGAQKVNFLIFGMKLAVVTDDFSLMNAPWVGRCQRLGLIAPMPRCTALAACGHGGNFIFHYTAYPNQFQRPLFIGRYPWPAGPGCVAAMVSWPAIWR